MVSFPLRIPLESVWRWNSREGNCAQEDQGRHDPLSEISTLRSPIGNLKEMLTPVPSSSALDRAKHHCAFMRMSETSLLSRIGRHKRATWPARVPKDLHRQLRWSSHREYNVGQGTLPILTTDGKEGFSSFKYDPLLCD